LGEKATFLREHIVDSVCE